MPKDFLEEEKETENTYDSIVNKYSSKNKERQFFEETYTFLENRYGKENVLSAYVHLDETTPHIHFGFLPVGTDKNGNKTVSSKLVCTRKELQTFHKDLSRHLEKTFGRKMSIENGATVEGNKAISELKRESAEDKLRQTNENALKIVSNAQREVQALQTIIAPLRAEYEAKKAYIAKCDDESNISMLIPEYVKETKTLFGKEYITVPKEKWIAKHVSANEKSILNKATKKFEETIERMQEELSIDHIHNLEKKINILESKVISLKLENNSLKNKLSSAEEEKEEVINKINRVLNNLPKEEAQHFVQNWEEEKNKTIQRER